ncbi:unnamed protein product [Strongylus vulgaris]|uniref:Uncharacterized protein n=1 Tax=Strongylus vulgaris TaxID=40348 RepID=A0A3P7JNB0_STRVU|nr:unnamed protein product [Strongylus vulgaris]VDM84856.1 unnamed protein product [Strongylus vulgaris]
MGDVAAAFAQHEITPKIIDNPPKQKLHVSSFLHLFALYCSLDAFQLVWDGIQVEPGMTMSTRNLKNAPRFNLPGADPESTFSLLMIGTFCNSDLSALTARHCKRNSWYVWTRVEFV